MNPPTHGDIQRDLGRMEGKSDAMGARLDRLEKIIEDGFRELREDIADLKQAESQRKGALAVIVAVGGAVGGMIWAVIEHFWK
jgi:hypothetical protein